METQHRSNDNNSPSDFIAIVLGFFGKNQSTKSDAEENTEDANEQRLLRHERFKAGTSQRINAIWI
jgi:hypothetical protein